MKIKIKKKVDVDESEARAIRAKNREVKRKDEVKKLERASHVVLKEAAKGKKPGPKKTVPTLRYNDGSQFPEKVSAEEFVIRAKMKQDGIDDSPLPKLLSKEEYRKLPRCGSKRRGDNDDKACQNIAGARTNHIGIGRCYLHGGNAGRKKKDTGFKQEREEDYDTISFNTLTPEEQKLWNNVSVDSETQLKHDLKLITIREKRMLDRMNQLIDEGRMSIVEESDEIKDTEDGIETKNVRKSTANMERIQSIEESLIRLGKQKLNIMEQLEKVRNGGATRSELTIGGKKGSPLISANIDLSSIPTEELQRQLKMLEEFEDDE